MLGSLTVAAMQYCPEAKKKCHTTEEEANRAAKEASTLYGKPQHPYDCKYCGYLHLTTKVPKKPKITKDPRV